MLDKRQQPRSWQDAFKFINHCPICNTNYDSKTARLLTHKGNANLVHITCAKCHSNFMAMVLFIGQGLSSVGMVTDLNFEDAARLYSTNPLTLDDTIDGHEELESDKIFKELTFNIK